MLKIISPNNSLFLCRRGLLQNSLYCGRHAKPAHVCRQHSRDGRICTGGVLKRRIPLGCSSTRECVRGGYAKPCAVLLVFKYCVSEKYPIKDSCCKFPVTFVILNYILLFLFRHLGQPR